MNSKICPFCQRENSCNVNHGACWCMSEKVPRSLIDLLPINSLYKDCICQVCIKLYKLDKANFLASLNGKTQ